MSNDYFEFINDNPLYIRNDLKSLNRDIDRIYNEVKINWEIYDKAIASLIDEEILIYKTLGNDDIEAGKKLLINIAENIYTNNESLKYIIGIVRSLVNKVEVLSTNTTNWIKKISDSNGEIDEKKLEKEQRRLEKEGKALESKIQTVLLNVSFPYEKDEKTGEIFNKSVKIKQGSSAEIKDLDKIQYLLDVYCNSWNDTINNYEYLMGQIINLTKEQGLTSENRSIQNFYKYLKLMQEEMNKAKINGKINASNLSDKFYLLFSRKGSYFGNLIGLFTEYCEFTFASEVIQRLQELKLSGETLRGDKIPRELTQSETNSKADRITILKGTLKNPQVTIPVSMKFRSDSLYKAHSGTISSISDLIEKESGGIKYSNYFKYIIINIPFWQHYGINDKYKKIILNFINNFAYIFISGGLQANKLSKAVFINGIFLEGNEYNEYFVPVSKVLLQIKEILLKEENVLNWSVFKKNYFGIKDYNKELDDISKIKENKDEKLLININNQYFNKFSSEIGNTDITFNHKIITSNIFGESHGVLL